MRTQVQQVQRFPKSWGTPIQIITSQGLWASQRRWETHAAEASKADEMVVGFGS